MSYIHLPHLYLNWLLSVSLMSQSTYFIKEVIRELEFEKVKILKQDDNKPSHKK